MDFNIKEFNIDTIDDNKKSKLLPTIPNTSSLDDDLMDLDLIVNKNKVKKSNSSSLNSSPRSVMSLNKATSNKTPSNLFSNLSDLNTDIKLNNNISKVNTPSNLITKIDTNTSKDNNIKLEINKSKPPSGLFSSLDDIGKPSSTSNIFKGPSNLDSLFKSDSKSVSKEIPDLDKEIRDLGKNIDKDFESIKNMNGPKMPTFSSSNTPVFNNNFAPINDKNNILNMSYEEVQYCKMKLLAKIDRLKNNRQFKKAGLRFVKEYSMNSDYEEMKNEYDIMYNNYQLRKSIDTQKQMFITFASLLERFSKSSYNPFDTDLDEFGDVVTDDIDSYEDIFEDLHLKYVGEGGDYPPELRLAFKFVASMSMCVIRKKIIEQDNSMPLLKDVLTENPQLKKQFEEASYKMYNKMQTNNHSNDMPPLYNNNQTPDLDTVLNSL